MTKELLKPCPFCGGKAEESSRYDSDDNRPDGEQLFIECSDCCAKSAEFYAVTINDIHLTPIQRKEQKDNLLQARKDSIEAWNKRCRRKYH
jgi:hypothetical protein